MIFTAPLVLLGLVALPGLYFLLRLTPPAPRVERFPPLALLVGLAAVERAAARMPVWLLLLRLAVAGLVILGLAGPAWQPAPALPGAGPVLLVVDNGWASAWDWPARRDAMLAVIARMGQAGRGVAVLATARGPDGAALGMPGVMTAAAARQLVTAMVPEPWPVDRMAAAAALQGVQATTRIYVADGITDGAGYEDFIRALRPDRVLSEGAGAALLMPPVLAANGNMMVHLAAGTARALVVLARDARGAVLARATFSGAGDARLDLPLAVSASVVALTLSGPATAGGTVLLDGSAHGALVGLASGGGDAEAAYLGPLFYLRRGLPVGSEVATGDVAALLADRPNVMILADLPLNNGQAAALRGWVRAGGILVRFAGPLTAEAPDDLAAGALLPGDRRLGGALTWSAPQGLAAFQAASPFGGLALEGNASVTRQLLADPTRLQATSVWAALKDGTPLILGAVDGGGVIVSVLTTANADWSNLVLSGMYPQMLARLVGLGHGMPAKPDAVLPALRVMDAFGVVTPARLGDAAVLTPAALPALLASPAHPPGLYGSGAGLVALNLGGHVPPCVAVDLPGAAPFAGQMPPLDFGPDLLAAALALLAADLLLSLRLRGFFHLAVAAAVIGNAAAARAQGAALATSLGFVRTGDASADAKSADGLAYLSALVSAHSSASLAPPVGVVPGVDDLALYPLLYWPVLADEAPFGPAACGALQAYMRYGGLLVIDTMGADAGGAGSGAGFAPGAQAALDQDTACLDLPLLQPVSARDVVAHCFYIVQDFAGRFDGAPVYLAAPAARDADGVSPVIIGGNDWAGAWARDAYGSPEEMPIPGGDDQRVVADRFGMNLVIYALTGSYKADQTNLPAVLNRLGP